MLNYILSLEKATNRVPLGMELIGLQGLPLWDTRHKGGSQGKDANPTLKWLHPQGTQCPAGSSDICLFNNKHVLEA